MCSGFYWVKSRSAKDRDCRTSLDNLCRCLAGGKLCYFKLEPLFQYVVFLLSFCHAMLPLGAPKPPLLQAEQAHFPQSFIIREILQTSDHPHDSPLGPLQQLHVFRGLGSPNVLVVLHVAPHGRRAEGNNHLPRPAGHYAFDAAQDMVSFLGCKCVLLAHVELLINQHPKVLILRLHSIHSLPSLYLCLGLPQPMYRTLHLPFLKFMMFSWATSQTCHGRLKMSYI